MKIELRSFAESDVQEVRDLMLRIFQDDFKYGYKPAYHRDYDNLATTYLHRDDSALFLATTIPDDADPQQNASSKIIGTAGVRTGGITSRRVPQEIKRRYNPKTTATIVRVFVAKEFRRHSIAKRLVERCLKWIREKKFHERVILDSEFALDFWRSLGAVEIFDERRVGGWCVHFEIPLRPDVLTPSKCVAEETTDLEICQEVPSNQICAHQSSGGVEARGDVRTCDGSKAEAAPSKRRRLES